MQRLPVEALRISPAIVETLRELDLITIGQLQQLPRETLPSRFSTELLLRLDQALGRVQELIVPVRADEPVEARWGCEEPIGNALAIEAVLRRLLRRVIRGARARGEGILRLEISLACAEQEPVRISIGCIRPTSRPKHLLDLIRLQLERLSGVAGPKSLRGPDCASKRGHGESALDPGTQPIPQDSLGYHAHAFSRGHASPTCPPKRGGHGTRRTNSVAPLGRGVVDFLVRATMTASVGESQPDLFGDPARRNSPRELDALLNRLSSRLGRAAVVQPELCPDHQPERAVEFNPIVGEKKTKPCEGEVLSPRARPLRVLPQPVPVAVMSLVPDGPPIRLRWHDTDHRIVHSDGPERIETGWWRQSPIRRDYYRVDTDSGGRYWLFRAMDDGRWFLHGDF